MRGHVRMSVIVDPELLKCVLNDMIEEAGVKLSSFLGQPGA